MPNRVQLISIILLVGLILSCSRDRTVPRPEHPRPDFQRQHWMNLNGEWDFRFDPLDHGIEQNWQNPITAFDRRIIVPFCWESKLSGVEETSGYQTGWYRRKFKAPAEWEGQHVWLRFDAVDWEARVWINGTEIGSHRGGYTPFAFDITEHATPGESATMVVRAFDPTDPELPTGKQSPSWYTFTSGIWQTVWLEARSATYLNSANIVPRNNGGSWSLEIVSSINGPDGQTKMRISSPDPTVESAEGQVEIADGTGEFSAVLNITSPKLWSPENPHLYDLTIEVSDNNGSTDTVQTYFGLRTIARDRYGDLPHESILLNGKPVYLRGALDQSFNPDGVYTAPSDEFMRGDIELAKSLGLNFLRIHIKPDEPRRLYWADKLGMLIMQDMPNTWEYSERSRQAWETTMREVIARDRNHPAIFSWVLFNESWGLGADEYRSRSAIQQWVQDLYREVKQTDPSRLVEDNSPNRRDHVETDINSWHFYIDDYERAHAHIEEVISKTHPGSTFNYVPGYRQGTAPLINSEYGAVSARGGDRDISWGFRYLTTLLRRHEKIQGYVYTEFTDIEFEHNGFANYDRSPKEFGYDVFVEDITIADLQGPDFVGFLTPPAIESEAGAAVEVPIFVSHFSELEGEFMVRPWLIGVDDLGRDIRVDLDRRPVTRERYRVTEQQPLRVTLPKDRSFVGALCMELLDEEDNRLAANFVNIISRHEESDLTRDRAQQIEALDSRRTLLRVSPRSFSSAHWKGIGAGSRFASRFEGEKFFFHGAGSVEYRFKVPQAVIDAGLIRLGLLVEVGTKARDERYDWPWEINPLDHPQTDGNKLPGTVNIIIGGSGLDPIELADDPADARGVLSHQAKIHHGSYGYLVHGEILLQGVPEILRRLRRDPTLQVIFEVQEGNNAHGLTIYGARSGRYPLNPTIIVETERDVVLDSGNAGAVF